MPGYRLLPLLLSLLIGIAGAHGSEVTFVAWNLQNYAPLPEAGKVKAAKSERSAALIVEMLGELRPDILALCEMGTAPQFREFQRRLADAGLDYPHAEHLQAADPHRHLALLSRYPFRSRQSLGDIALVINGTHEKMRRGILDVTLLMPGGQPLRILGVHLKSKLELRNENEALLRRSEAYHLRRHLDAILSTEPDAPLLLYGDFNDTRDQITLREITGERGQPTALTPLPLADAQGDRWTHHWSKADLYARIDFVMVSRVLRSKIDAEQSRLHRHPSWREASDHRPLVVTFKPHAFSAP